MKNVRLIEFKTHGNSEDGFLTAIEKKSGLPFDIQRVYTVTDTKEKSIRGFHAHKKLEQIFFCTHGKIEVMCEDQEGNQEHYCLDNPYVGLYCGPMVWHTLTYYASASLMVLASDIYNENDYIREYKEFKEYNNASQ